MKYFGPMISFLFCRNLIIELRQLCIWSFSN